MKINWKIRFQNKTFVVSLFATVLTFAYTVLGMFGITPSITENSISDGFMALVNLLVVLGVIIDPTTPNIVDSDRAMTYGKSSKSK
ncbi:MAG: phage holin [Oscillospiraceae bacterium]|jgi:phi LC3 family holin|nr:phage holin [Oscillospiraceae bacterium]